MLGRAAAILLETCVGWETTGPWQIVRDREALEDVERLRGLLRSLGVLVG
jgi:hypothetical protein